MKDWANRLDSILQLNGRELLTHADKIGHKIFGEPGGAYNSSVLTFSPKLAWSYRNLYYVFATASIRHTYAIHTPYLLGIVQAFMELGA